MSQVGQVGLTSLELAEPGGGVDRVMDRVLILLDTHCIHIYPNNTNNPNKNLGGAEPSDCGFAAVQAGGICVGV